MPSGKARNRGKYPTLLSSTPEVHNTGSFNSTPSTGLKVLLPEVNYIGYVI
jgi:hypothetical protein